MSFEAESNKNRPTGDAGSEKDSDSISRDSEAKTEAGEDVGSGASEEGGRVVSELEAASDIEREFYRKYPFWWWFALVGPAAIGLTILSFVYLNDGMDGLKNLVIAICATFLIFGRFVILLGGNEPLGFFDFTFQMTSEALFVMVTTMDFLVAFFVAFHMGVLFKAPFFGGKLEEMVSDGRFILKHQPWIRNVAFIGLVFFVIFPSSTTGSIGGSIFGRLLGMRRARVVVAILIGSLLGNGLMYFLAGWLKDILPSDNIWLKLGGIGAMILVLFIVERYYRRMKKKYLQVEADAENARLAESGE